MTIEQIEARLHELGGGPELVAWIDSHGFDAELICFAARCLAGAAGTVQGATAFLSGFLSALCLLESGTRPRADTEDSLTRAVATVSSRGRHAVIADHCDLGAVAQIENAVGRSLASDCDDALERTFVRLFESGLATGLVAAGG